MRYRFALTLSLLLLLLCAAAWIRTHFCTDILERHTQSVDGTVRHYVFSSTEGAILLRYTIWPFPNPQGIFKPYWKYERHRTTSPGWIHTLNPTLFGRLGFLAMSLSHWGTDQNYFLAVPYWLGCLFFASWSLIAFRRARYASRRAKGLCEHCGYDLRASPDRCPECGELGVGSAAATSLVTAPDSDKLANS